MAAVGLLGLAWLYLHSLSPAFPPNDSPETIAAALTLGIQHPPGYPLAALLGRLSIVGLGLGSAAWRMNCLSAGLGLLSALLAGALAWRLSEGSPRSTRFGGALAAGAWLGVGATLWEQATEAKGGLYLLNLGLGFGLWHACLSAVRASRAGLRAAALLAGLMLAAHHLSAAPWLLVALCWLAWAVRAGRLQAPLTALWLLLPGLAVYAYLPLRAAQDPLLDLGHPADWAQFKWMLTRAGYAAGPPLDAALLRDQLGVLLRGLWNGSWYGLLLVPVALGFGALWRGRREAALALGGAALLSLLAGSVLNSTPADNRWLVLIFCLPGLALLAVAGGVGWGRLAERLRLGPYLLAGGLVLIAALAWKQWPRLDRRGSYAAWDYAQDLALSLPQGALYVGEGDYHVLPLIYLQAQGRRRDVSLILATLAGKPWYQEAQRRREPGLLLEPAEDDGAAQLALIKAEAPRRPVFLGPYSSRLNAEALAPLRMRQNGLLREIAPAFDDAAPGVAQAWAGRAPARRGEAAEPVEEAMLPWYTVALVQTGNEALMEHRLAESLDAYRRASQRPGPKPLAAIQVNMAHAWEAAGSPKAARLAYEEALRAEPGFPPAKEGLDALQAAAKQKMAATLLLADRLAAGGGHDAEAIKLYNEALQAGFQTANLWRNIGVLLLRQGDRAQAARAFRRGLEMDPGDKALLDYLGVAESN